MRFIQANLQRSRLATVELLESAKRQGVSVAMVQEPYVGKTGTLKQHPGTQVIQCTLNRQKPVKAAIIVFDDRLEVIHDPQLVTETEASVLLVVGKQKLGLISVYYEGDQDIDQYLVRTQSACQLLKTENLIVAGDVNAWSHWWGSTSEDPRGAAYTGFLNSMGFHILNTGDTPTFETHRGDKLCTSIVDVTACSDSLLGKIENWRVDRSITTSDHNAITFSLKLDSALKQLRPTTTRKYNTKKARWSDFAIHFTEYLAKNNVSPNTIQNINCPKELESLTEKYVIAIQDACHHAIPNIGSWTGNPKPPWWSKLLEKAKAEVLRKKRRIRNAASRRRQQVISEYLAAKTRYTDMANDAQTESWKEFCTTQVQESMWDGIYRVIRKTAKRHEDMLLRNAEGKTLCPESSAELLANTFYPDDTTTTDTPYHTQLRKMTEGDHRSGTVELSEDDPPFTPVELDAVLKTLNPKKAPGPDGLTSDICTKAIHCAREVFMAIANKCLSLPHFPKQWKIAHVVIIRKPGKDDYTHPKSYRPIGLLSVLGKIVEKMMVGRLQWHILPTINKHQYGFMPQRGTEDALYDLVNHVRSEVANKKIALIISLDIEGAFDNAWWPALKQQLLLRKCPKNLYAMVDSYLTDRKIRVNYARAENERNTTKGCVQGSIGGPTFWNIILDTLLNKLTGEGIYCQAFADDVVLVFSGHEMNTMEPTINNTLNEIVEWGRRNKLNFAAHKTKAMIITKKLKYDTPNLRMSNNRLQLVEEIKLLGLIIDSKLTFKAHVAAICKKTADIYKQLACAAKVTWGLNREVTRTIYVAVIEPIVLYAASIWYPAVELQMIRNQLDALQRGFAQKICRAYRTVSLTSALVLSGLLPLDLRIQEAASLYLAKKNLTRDYLPPGKEIEQPIHYTRQPHPSSLRTIGYQILEKLDQETLDTHQITGPHIYTDGSKIEGKVGAALTWWEKGTETNTGLYKLDSACTVFQAELYALHKAVLLARRSKNPVVNIMSDSKSSLELLENPKSNHPIAMKVKKDLQRLTEEERQVRLFWIRAHIGTPGNERADELAKSAAQADNAPHYAKIPLSYVKRKIREESVRKWQDRYSTSQTGRVTKIFFPDVSKAYSTVRKMKVTPLLCQAFTGHGGIAEYLHRFKLRDSPGCECDRNINETVEHITLDCPQFAAVRMDTEAKMDATITKSNLHILLINPNTRTHLLTYIENAFRIVHKRNSTLTPRDEELAQNTLVDTPNPPASKPDNGPPAPNTMSCEKFLRHGEMGEAGIRIRGVALFMDTNEERLGIGFCNSGAKGRVIISPGLATLLNRSTSKNTMRRRDFDALPETIIAQNRCRMVRIKNKIIALFQWENFETPFTQASSVLKHLGATNTGRARRISVDAMAVSYEKGVVDNYLGCKEASKNHEVVVYENRGEDLSFLKPRDITHRAAPDQTGNPPTEPPSGSEKLQRKRAQGCQNITKQQVRTKSSIAAAINTLSTAAKRLTGEKDKIIASIHTEKVKTALQTFLTLPQPKPKASPDATQKRVDLGQVEPPQFRTVTRPLDHVINAFLEYQALIRAEQAISQRICEKIMQSYQLDNTGLLKVRLEEAEAAIYNNETSEIIVGKDTGSYMAAYSATGGFVDLDEEETKRKNKIRFKTPTSDPLVVIAKCTKVMLNGRIMEAAHEIAGPNNELLEHWEVPKYTWVNGVPGCGKTTWIVRNFDPHKDVVITTTTEAAKDLREKLASSIGADAKTKVRTMASVLVNGFRSNGCNRLMIDEALMNHFGAIVMATRLASANETLLIGDINQLPFIDRNNVFDLHYCRPNMVAKINKELLCTHRNPMDVAFALSEVYNGIYSSRPRMRSLQLKRYTGAMIPKDTDNTLYLTHTQGEKETLKANGYGTGKGSRVNTVHEAQGATFETVLIVRTTQKKIELHESVPHAVVAVSRHTNSCTYYTDDCSDATAHFILKAEKATSEAIRDYIIKMALQNNDETVARALIEGKNQ